MLTMSERNAFRAFFYEISKQLKTAKSKAVKEFAERLKEKKRELDRFILYDEDIDSLIKEMESLEGVEETPLDYEEFELEEYERMNERDLKGGL